MGFKPTRAQSNETLLSSEESAANACTVHASPDLWRLFSNLIICPLAFCITVQCEGSEHTVGPVLAGRDDDWSIRNQSEGILNGITDRPTINILANLVDGGYCLCSYRKKAFGIDQRGPMEFYLRAFPSRSFEWIGNPFRYIAPS